MVLKRFASNRLRSARMGAPLRSSTFLRFCAPFEGCSQTTHTQHSYTHTHTLPTTVIDEAHYILYPGGMPCHVCAIQAQLKHTHTASREGPHCSAATMQNFIRTQNIYVLTCDALGAHTQYDQKPTNLSVYHHTPCTMTICLHSRCFARSIVNIRFIKI